VRVRYSEEIIPNTFCKDSDESVKAVPRVQYFTWEIRMEGNPRLINGQKVPRFLLEIGELIVMISYCGLM